MSLTAPAAERPIVPPKKRGGMFALSMLYLLLGITGFWGHPSVIAVAALIGVICMTSLSTFQFGSRTFDPVRAAARTANLTKLTRDRLRKANTVLAMAAAILIVVVVFVHFFVNRHFFSDWMIFLYQPIFIWQPAIADLLGDPPRNHDRTFGPRADWTANLKPIHSDKWGQRA